MGTWRLPNHPLSLLRLRRVLILCINMQLLGYAHHGIITVIVPSDISPDMFGR